MSKIISIAEDSDNVTVVLQNVTLTYPELYRPTRVQKNDDREVPRFRGRFLFKKGSKADKVVEQAIKHIVKVAYKGKMPDDPDRICYKDGATKPHLAGHSEKVNFVNATNEKRPALRALDGETLVEDDDMFHRGTIVNAIVRFYAIKVVNKPCIFSILVGVQFVNQGTPLDDVDVDSIFGGLTEEEEDNFEDALS